MTGFNVRRRKAFLRSRFTDILHKLEMLHLGLWSRVMLKFSLFS